MKRLITIEGKTAILNTETDTCIWKDRRGLDMWHTAGTDLYVHTTRGGRKIFYEYRWNFYQGVPNIILPVSENEAKNFLQRKYSEMTEEEQEEIEKIFPGIFTETA